MVRNRLDSIVILALGLVASCGGFNATPFQPPAPQLKLTYKPTKALQFSWDAVDGAEHYKLLEDPDGKTGFTQIGSDLPAGTTGLDHVVPLVARLNAKYMVQACNALKCSDSNVVSVGQGLVNSIGYIKASNTGIGDRFGYSVSLSGDGNTLAVGARYEASDATGVNGDQTNNDAGTAGAVYVFTRSGATWSQQAYIKASNTGGPSGILLSGGELYGDAFGWSVSLSADGNTLAVGAPLEDSSVTGVTPGPADNKNNAARNAGAVYVFTRSKTTWSQQAYVKTSNPGAFDYFGDSVSLSADGNTLAVGATGTFTVGAVHVFTRSRATWSQQAYVNASNPDSGDRFGGSLSLSGDGDTLAVGATGEDSKGEGVTPGSGTPNNKNNDAKDAGAVYVFTRSKTTWSQQAYIKASNTGGPSGTLLSGGELYGDAFGWSVSLSGDGDTLAVGATGEDSNAKGVNEDQTNNAARNAGAAYVFTRSGATWSQQAYIKASNTDSRDEFGFSVSLSADGNTLAVGAYHEDSNAKGVNENQNNNAEDAGAVYMFTRSGATWSQRAYIKASNTGEGDSFGTAVSLSGDGNTLAVGARYEDSNAQGVGDKGVGNWGDNAGPKNNRAGNSGAVYLY